MGRFAITSVSRLVNINELEKHFLETKKHFTKNFQGNVNPTEVVANLVCKEYDFVAGNKNAHKCVKGSCTLMILTADRIVVARDKLGWWKSLVCPKKNCVLIAGTGAPTTKWY